MFNMHGDPPSNEPALPVPPTVPTRRSCSTTEDCVDILPEVSNKVEQLSTLHQIQPQPTTETSSLPVPNGHQDQQNTTLSFEALFFNGMDSMKHFGGN
jgi:hypothetical protein